MNWKKQFDKFTLVNIRHKAKGYDGDDWNWVNGQPIKPSEVKAFISKVEADAYERGVKDASDAFIEIRDNVYDRIAIKMNGVNKLEPELLGAIDAMVAQAIRNLKS